MGSDGGRVNPKMAPLPVLPASMVFVADNPDPALVSAFGDMQRGQEMSGRGWERMNALAAKPLDMVTGS